MQRVRAADIAPDALTIIWSASEEFQYTRPHVARCLSRVPARFHKRAAHAWARRVESDGYTAANLELGELAEAFSAGGLDLAASDADIRARAEQRAREARAMLAEYLAYMQTARTAREYWEGVRARVDRLARRSGVPAPQARTYGGMVRRACDPGWWRRALRRGIVREVERQAIRLGLVHKRASIYASGEAVERRAGQRRRNRRALESMTMENERGQVFTLAELADKSVSRPELRRAELMTRISGFEEFARARGDAAMFYTVTTPSRMHARLAKTGEQNPQWDGTTPRAAQEYLRRTWARVRAQLAKRRIHSYGFRVAEPHHDATPHWHLLLFCRPSYAPALTEIMRRQFSRDDADELNNDAARKARFHPVEIDWERGSAAGYIAVYVAKNVDGYRAGEDAEAAGAWASDTVRNVDAWAATWGIRQFQQIGGPGVTIWRELRRLGGPQQLPMFDDLLLAADAGDWREYVRLMGGIEIRKRDRRLNLWRVDYEKTNRYGEPAPAAVEGVEHFALELCRTRMHEWRKADGMRGDSVVERGSDGGSGGNYRGGVLDWFPGGGGDKVNPEGAAPTAHADALRRFDSAGAVAFGFPWTGVNNCNQVEESTDCGDWLDAYERASAEPEAPPWRRLN